MKKIIISNIFYILFVFLLLTNNSISEKKITIELKIGNEILTNIDIENEQDYLVALNTSLKDVPKNQLKEVINKQKVLRNQKSLMMMSKMLILKKSKISLIKPSE